ncbi:MAG: hypothetical protein IJ334_17465 [Clostridia bacterium]|nr:hypothetical protein [Clostridia bacterium]
MENKRKLAMLCMTTVLLTSCSSAVQETDDSTQNTTAVTEAAVQTEDTELTRIEPELPESDFGGYTFRVYSKGDDHPHWVSKDITAEEENGDPINDAVFRRNSVICERYNFTIEEIRENGWVNNITRAVTAGEDAYDLLQLHPNSVVNVLVENQMLMDLHDVPYMNLSAPWYDQNANESLSIGGALYATVGEISIMDNDATWVVLFNKEMAEEFDVGNMYDLVNSGKWTLETLYTLSENVSGDINGDGVLDESDRWGVQNEPYNVMAFCQAAGEKIVDKDSDDLPVVTLGSDRFISVFTRAMDLLTDQSICMNYNDYAAKYPGTDVWTGCMDPAFTDGRVLFNVTGLNRVTMFRSMEADFGILPMPKFEETMENYICPVQMWCSSSIAVLKSASDPERTGIIIEALSAESMYTLTPAYYDITLKTKLSRDEESAAMLDLIFENRVFDIGAMYNWGNVYQLTLDLAAAKNYNFQSAFARNEKVIDIKIGKAISAITEGQES